MNADQVLIQFANVEQSAQVWGQEAQTLDDILQRLRNATDTLLSSGLQGDYVRAYQNRCTDLEQSLQQSGSRVNQVGQALAWTADAFGELDQQGAVAFANADSAASYLNPLQPGQIDPRALMYLGMVGAGPVGALLGLVGAGSSDGFDSSIPALYGLATQVDTVFGVGAKDGLDNAIFKGLTGEESRFGGAAVGGVFDWVFGNDHSAARLGGDVVSGVVMEGLGIGEADAAVQLIGNVGAEVIKDSSGWLSNGDPAFANQISDSATKFQSDLSAADPANLISDEVTDLLNGNSNQMVDDATKFVQGVGGTLTNGVSLASDTVEGFASHLLGIPANTIQQTVNQDMGQALNFVGGIFGW